MKNIPSAKKFLPLSAAILTTLIVNLPAHAQTVVADWTLQEGSGYTDMSGDEEAVDSVGGHTMTGFFNDGNFGTFGTSSIGGPSTNPTSFPSSGLGWYMQAAGTTTLPTNDFTISLYEEASSTSETGVFFSSNSDNAGSIQIGMENNDFVAILNDGSGNLDGTTLGSLAATTADTQLSLTDIDGTFTLTANGTSATPVFSATSTGFDNVFIGVTPGGNGPNFTGYMSDVTITSGVTSLSVPEPSTYLMLGLGFLGLIVVVRRRAVRG